MTKRITLIAVALAFSAATAAPSAQGAAGQAAAPNQGKVATAVQGVWALTTANGQDLAGSGQEVLITITGDKYVQTLNGQVVEKGSFKIDETKKPFTLDILIAEGEEAGQKQLAIFDLDATGKTMKVAISQAGATVRPSAFAVAEGVESLVMVKK